MEEIFSCLWIKTWASPVACHPLLGDSLWYHSATATISEVGIVGSLTVCSPLGQFGSASSWKLQGQWAVSLCCLYFPNSSLPPTTPKKVCFTSCQIEMGNSYRSESRGSFKGTLAFVDFFFFVCGLFGRCLLGPSLLQLPDPRQTHQPCPRQLLQPLAQPPGTWMSSRSSSHGSGGRSWTGLRRASPCQPLPAPGLPPLGARVRDSWFSSNLPRKPSTPYLHKFVTHLYFSKWEKGPGS